MNTHERRIEELEHELSEAERRVARQHQRVYGGKRPYDPIREAELARNVEGAVQRLRLERERGSAGAD